MATKLFLCQIEDLTVGVEFQEGKGQEQVQLYLLFE